jgi:hypothetical protein
VSGLPPQCTRARVHLPALGLVYQRIGGASGPGSTHRMVQMGGGVDYAAAGDEQWAAPPRSKPPLILGGLSGAGARSLPELGVLAFPPAGGDGEPAQDVSLTSLLTSFDSDRRRFRDSSGSSEEGGSSFSTLPAWAETLGGRRAPESPNVTVLPAKPDIWRRQVEPGRAPPRRRRPKSRDSMDARWSTPAKMMTRHSTRRSRGAPASSMQRDIDLTASDPTDERVDRGGPGPVGGWNGGGGGSVASRHRSQASSGSAAGGRGGRGGWDTSAGSLADFERGFSAGHRHASGMVARSVGRWDTTVRAQLHQPIQSPFRPQTSLLSGSGRRGRASTRDLHRFYCEVTEREVQLQVHPSSYADELLNRLNPHLRAEVVRALLRACVRACGAETHIYMVIRDLNRSWRGGTMVGVHGCWDGAGRSLCSS